MGHHRRVVAGCAAGYLLAGCGFHVPPPCKDVHGVQEATSAPAGCTSPVGSCTTGRISESVLLDGDTEMIGESIAGSAGLGAVEPQTTLSYSGRLTITTAHGSLSLQELGLFDVGVPGGLFTSRDVVVSGSGRFTGASGYLFFRGRGLMDFTSELSGNICPGE